MLQRVFYTRVTNNSNIRQLKTVRRNYRFSVLTQPQIVQTELRIRYQYTNGNTRSYGTILQSYYKVISYRASQSKYQYTPYMFSKNNVTQSELVWTDNELRMS
jgi:hypothetical protein